MAQKIKRGRVARSIRGEIVDFDLLEIKQKMASAPKPVEVKNRETFIDQKLRRKPRTSLSKVDEMRQKALEAKQKRDAELVEAEAEFEETPAEIVDAPVEQPKAKKKINLLNQ